MVQVLCPVVVGREAETAALDRALADAVDGRGGCVALTGEPGIGKSRLARELAARAAGRGLRVVTGRAVPSSVSGPYRPLIEVLLRVRRDGPALDGTTVQPWSPVLAALAPEPAGPPPPAGPLQPAAQASPAALGEALLHLLRHAAPDGALVLLEDLHWADPDTIAVVEYLADNATDERLLCLVTVRDHPPSAALDLVRRQRGRPGCSQLALDRMGADAVAAMARACLGDVDAEQLDRVRRGADGVPLLVEELLGATGVPDTFAGTVRERLTELPPAAREVLEAAAVLGRHVDWELLPAVSGQPPDAVTAALAAATERMLLVADGGDLRFRHALTRDAVLDTVLPPRQRALARAALDALDATGATGATEAGAGVATDAGTGELTGTRRDVAADLAVRAGDERRAGLLLTAAGRDSLRLGALATATATLRRAVDLLDGDPRRPATELLLVEALALAGRVDEAAAVAARLEADVTGATGADAVRLQARLRLAQAAVAASRWPMARHQLDAARPLLATAGTPATSARVAVLDAELAMAADEQDRARALADRVTRQADAEPAVRCHAWEVVGRTDRSRDLAAARHAFAQALAGAEAAGLPVWRMRALHELGTIDLFDHAGTERLHAARAAAETAGAASTVAVLDLQLAAAYTCRWELDRSDEHSLRALRTADRLGLPQVRGKAYAHLVGTASMRADEAETERLLALMRAAEPEDRMLEGFGWGSRGMRALLAGDAAGALEPYGRGIAILATLPHAEPAALRAVWPLLLASLGDRRARAAVEDCRRLGVEAIALNGGLVGYAEAVLTGRAGERAGADRLAAAADRRFANCAPWRDLARLLAAPAALADGWGEPARWLAAAESGFDARGLPALAGRCRQLRPDSTLPWAGAGLTTRECEVLRLVVEGLGNKQIATRLRVSPRTVEKHVENLLRKTGTRTRTELAVATASPTT